MRTVTVTQSSGRFYAPPGIILCLFVIIYKSLYDLLTLLYLHFVVEQVSSLLTAQWNFTPASCLSSSLRSVS